jgi:hypothetical protein
MFCKIAGGVRSVLIITATLFAPALSSSLAIAETKEVVRSIDPDAVTAAQNLLQVMKFKTNVQPLFVTVADRMKLAAAADPSLRNTRLDVRQLALQLCHQREDDLITDIAKYYATRFTAEELSEVSTFYASEAGTLFLEFNQEQLKNPPTRESASSAFTRRFSADQRTAIVRHLASAVGQKTARLQPELKKKIGELSVEWVLKIGFDIERQIRSGQPATLSRA